MKTLPGGGATVAVARKLIDEGADINAQYPRGFTALDYAAETGHRNAAYLLRQAGGAN